MNAENRSALRLASSLSDGENVDWDAEEKSTTDEQELAVVRGLRIVASVSEIARSQPKPEPSTEDSTMLDDATRTQLHDAAPTRSGSGPEVGAKWGHLELNQRLGEGSFGEVFLARDTHLDRHVALKLLRPRTSPARLESAAVLREGRLLAKVRHPNVVEVYGAEEIDGALGLWMEYVRGETLEQMLKDHGTFGPDEAISIGIHLCRALSAVHKAGVVHRDVKTQNVMRAEGGRLVLMDFGAGWIPEEDDPGTASISGTPLYMAPETVLQGSMTAQSDLYSLGVLLYHLVTGSYPVRGANMIALRAMHERREMRLLRDERADLPEGLIEVIEKALAPDPSARYATAGQMEQALSACTHVESSLTQSQPDIEPGQGRIWNRRASWLFAAAAVLVVTLSGYGVWKMLTPAPGEQTRQIVDQGTVEYTVNASLLRFTPDGKRDRLESGSQLAVGDNVALEFSGSTDLYVYVINQDEAGNAFALFPLPSLELKNPLPGGSAHIIPGAEGDQHLSWEVDSVGGTEHLLIVASPERLVEFEAEMAGLLRPQSGQAAVAVPDRALVHLRGLGKLGNRPAEVTGASAGKLFDMAEELSPGDTVVKGPWVWKVELKNPGSLPGS